MEISGLIHKLPGIGKAFIILYLITISFGFFTGVLFLEDTTRFSTKGVEENYLGNENDEEAEIMIFKKSEREIWTIIHTHILSMGTMFFTVGLVLLTTSLNKRIKKFLLIEPFISLLLTFGGIWVMWSGISWFKYIVMISGTVMTITFAASVIICIWQILIVKDR